VRSEFVGTSISVSAAGGSGTGTINFTVDGPGCSISGNSLTASVATTCTVYAYKAASNGFNGIRSNGESFNFKEHLVAPTITSTFAKRDSIQVDYVVASGIVYKLDLLDAAGTAVKFVCGYSTVCTGSNLISSLKSSTNYSLKLTASNSSETASTVKPVTTYASVTLYTSITSFTAAYDLVTVSFNPQADWSYRLENANTCGVAQSPYSSTSPIVWTSLAGWKCGMNLTFKDAYGNTGFLALPAPTLLDNALPSVQLVSASPNSITGSGTVVVTVRITDDVAVSDNRATNAGNSGSLVTLRNAAGTEVLIAARLTFQNGTNKDQLFATTFNIPAGFAPGTYTIFVRAADWLNKYSTVAVGTITIS
jgi:hypothetical protein